MAFFRCYFYSESLGKNVSINVLLPQKTDSQYGIDATSGNKEKYPVLYLLHGYSDNETIWMRRTLIERYLENKDLIVVMPDGGKSFYRNYGVNDFYEDFIVKDLISFVSQYLPVETDRENSYIGGISMGGYGSLAIGLKHHDKFSKIFAMSSVADITEQFTSGYFVESKQYIFGEAPLEGSDNDLFALALKGSKNPKKPEIFLSCGTKDWLYDANTRLKNHLTELNYSLKYCEAPENHGWTFWNYMIEKHLKEDL